MVAVSEERRACAVGVTVALQMVEPPQKTGQNIRTAHLVAFNGAQVANFILGHVIHTLNKI